MRAALIFALCFSQSVLAIQLMEHKVLQTSTNSTNEEKLLEFSKELEDNMSLSEIIQKRFKNNIKITKIWKAEEVDKLIIEKPQNSNSDVDLDGSLL
jgi:hypothetical protein